jgi:hypothetical protein
VCPRTGDPSLTRRLVLIVLGGGVDTKERSLPLFLATAPTDNDRIRDHRVVRTRSTTTPALGRNTLLVVDRAARRTRYVGIVDQRAWIVGRERTPDRGPGRVTATDNRLATIVALLEDRGVGPAANSGRDPFPAVIDDLGADCARRKKAAYKRTIIRQPRLARVVHVISPQRLPVTRADVPGNPDIAVIVPHEPLTAREPDQHRGHSPILRDRLTGPRKHLCRRAGVSAVWGSKRVSCRDRAFRVIDAGDSPEGDTTPADADGGDAGPGTTRRGIALPGW